jgi:RNA polymerase sigma-70 factor, ECF subfamily
MNEVLSLEPYTTRQEKSENDTTDTDMLNDRFAETQNDMRVYDYIYGKYLPLISRYVQKKVANKQDVEDLTQEVFGKFLELYMDPDFKWKSFSGWIYKITNNLIVDHYRKNDSSNGKSFIDVDLLEEVHSGRLDPSAGGNFQPEKALIKNEDEETVRNFLGVVRKIGADGMITYELDEGADYKGYFSSTEQRRVLYYRFYLGMKSKDIALMMGKTEGSVKIIQHRAMKTLAELVARKRTL